MPKCITCGLRTWFKPLDCDCKHKALKERARPVIPKTQPARHTPTHDFNGRPMAETDNSMAYTQTASMQHQNTMASLATDVERPSSPVETVEYKHCHTPSYSTPSHDSSPSYSSDTSCSGGSTSSDY